MASGSIAGPAAGAGLTLSVVYPSGQDKRLRAGYRFLHRAARGHAARAEREQRLGPAAVQPPGPGSGKSTPDPRRSRHPLAGMPPELFVQQAQQRPAAAAEHNLRRAPRPVPGRPRRCRPGRLGDQQRRVGPGGPPARRTRCLPGGAVPGPRPGGPGRPGGRAAPRPGGLLRPAALPAASRPGKRSPRPSRMTSTPSARSAATRRHSAASRGRGCGAAAAR